MRAQNLRQLTNQKPGTSDICHFCPLILGGAAKLVTVDTRVNIKSTDDSQWQLGKTLANISFITQYHPTFTQYIPQYSVSFGRCR